MSFKHLFSILTLVLLAGFSFAQQKYASGQHLADAIRSNDFLSFQTIYNDKGVTEIDPISGIRPLHLACKMGKIEFVDFMIQKEQSMETGIYVTQEEMPPIVHALQGGHTHVVQLLLDKGNRTADGTWMNKPYLFHAQDLGASQAAINTLKSNGASEKNFQHHQALAASKATNANLAQKWTDEIDAKVQLNKYQTIDVWNLNVKASNMLAEIGDKYGSDSAIFEAEATEIMEYRLNKLQSILQADQLSKLGQIAKK